MGKLDPELAEQMALQMLEPFRRHYLPAAKMLVAILHGRAGNPLTVEEACLVLRRSGVPDEEVPEALSLFDDLLWRRYYRIHPYGTVDSVVGLCDLPPGESSDGSQAGGWRAAAVDPGPRNP